jgi:predicted alpha-1,2-mannosidase
MVGDPASIVITDTYLKGIQDFDVQKAYKAMLKSADQLENNPLRPGLKDYIEKGYLTTDNGGSVSTTEEYNAADYSIALLAKALGKKEDYKRFKNRSISYRKLFDKKLDLLRPRKSDGSWYEPFNPLAGANFTKNIGFIEGNAWQYAFMVPHDIEGLKKLMGGNKAFTNQLQKVFDTDQFDMANEPDIAYPYLFNYVKGEEWRTQKELNRLMATYFKNAPDGLPGNDDTGTMSTWIVYSMISDFVEDGLLFKEKNALGALYIINGVITLFFAYITIKIFQDVSPQGMDYLGMMAFVIGLVSELTAYLFSKARDCEE